MTPEDTGTAPVLTVTEASRASGKSERTLRRWLAEGRLSAIQTPDGKRIDRAELLRLGLLRRVPEGPGAPGTMAAVPTGDVLSDLRRQLDDMRSQRDHWQALAERALAAALPEPKGPPRRRWWAWGRR